MDLLEDICASLGWNQDTVTDASTLLSATTRFEFLMGFVVAWKALTLVKPFSISRSITVPFLDHLSQLQSNDQQLVIRGLSLVPAIMNESGIGWKKHVIDLATVYESDLSVDSVDMEIVWETKLKDHIGELPS